MVRNAEIMQMAKIANISELISIDTHDLKEFDYL